MPRKKRMLGPKKGKEQETSGVEDKLQTTTDKKFILLQKEDMGDGSQNEG